MLNIHVTTLPLLDMRYPTLGDYVGTPDRRLIMVADLGDWRKEWLIHYHENIEQTLCFLAGISERDIKAFDEMFEEETRQGVHKPDDEPGDDPRAPYYSQHQYATKCEREICEKFFKMNWDEYMASIYKVYEETFFKEPK